MKWLSETHLEDALVLRIGRDGETLVAEWPELGTLRATADGSAHSFAPAPDADRPSVEKLEHGVVHALLRHLRGQLSLHASAVSIEGRAAVFIGASGSGKSTFAAYLGGRGYAMLADDVAHIDRAPSREGKGDSFLVQPSEVAHYLMQDACEALGIPAEEERAKTRVVAANVGDKAELAAMFCFVDADDIHVTRLTGFQTIEVLSPCVARFVFDDPGVLRADLERLGALLSVVPLYRIARPRGFEHLAAIEQRMLGMVQK